MMRRNLGSVCAKFGRGRRSHSTGTSSAGPSDSDLSYAPTLARIMLAGFAAGYIICGQILSPVETDFYRESIQELESGLLDLEEKLKELGDT